MSKPDADKQKEVTAASFRRIAKALRHQARDVYADPMAKALLRTIASELDAEAKLLRSMR